MNYLNKAAAAVLLTSSFFAAGCGQVHIGTVDSTRVQTEAPQIKAVIDEANGKLMEAQQLQMETQRKMAGLNQMYTIQLQQKLDVAVQDIVKEKKLDIVLDSGTKTQPSVLTGGVDITDEVIGKLQ